MELANPQILKSLLNYTSSRESFVAIQFLFMASLMFHEQKLFVSRNANELRNGFLPRYWYCSYFECSLCILHNRSGNFYPIFLGLIRHQSEEHSRQFNFLYIKVGATEQIGEISDSVYSKQKVSQFHVLQVAAVRMQNCNSVVSCLPTTQPSALMSLLSPLTGTSWYPRGSTILYWKYQRLAVGRRSRQSITSRTLSIGFHRLSSGSIGLLHHCRLLKQYYKVSYSLG